MLRLQLGGYPLRVPYRLGYGTPGRLLHEPAPPARIGQRLQMLPQQPHRRRRQPSVLAADRLLGDLDEARPLPASEQPALFQQAPVVRDGPRRVGGKAVDHEQQRQGALPGLVEELPRHRVGIPLRAGDEDAQVGHRQQLIRHLPMRLDHGVEVGSVEKREFLEERMVGGHHLQRTGGAGTGSVAGQESVAIASGVAAVAPHDGHPGGGANGPWFADRGLGEGVDHRRLAASRGADDHRHHRRLQIAEPGQQVLPDGPCRPVAHLAAGRQPGTGQGEVRLGEFTRQRVQCRPQVGGRGQCGSHRRDCRTWAPL